MPWRKITFPAPEEMRRIVTAAGCEQRVGFNGAEYRQPGTQRWLRLQQAWELLNLRRVLTDAERRSGVVYVREREEAHYA